MTREQNGDHEKALARCLAEQFVHVQSSGATAPGGWGLCSLAELLMRALLGQGAKSLTHSARVFENYQQVLIWMR